MTTTNMASAVFTSPNYYRHNKFTVTKPTVLYSCGGTSSKTWRVVVSQLGLSPCCEWSGLRRNGFSISRQLVSLERRRKCKGKTVFASLFGVGAPEALVIGVVALLVFGPKGLAEVARTLGKTLRSFQPTIRELQEVSREFKSTLEKEIGLDEIRTPAQGGYNSTFTPSSGPSPVSPSEDSQAQVDPTNGSPPPKEAYSTEDYLKITEEQLKASAALKTQEQASSSPAETQSGPKTQAEDIV